MTSEPGGPNFLQATNFSKPHSFVPHSVFKVQKFQGLKFYVILLISMH